MRYKFLKLANSSRLRILLLTYMTEFGMRPTVFMPHLVADFFLFSQRDCKLKKKINEQIMWDTRMKKKWEHFLFLWFLLRLKIATPWFTTPKCIRARRRRNQNLQKTEKISAHLLNHFQVPKTAPKIKFRCLFNIKINSLIRYVCVCLSVCLIAACMYICRRPLFHIYIHLQGRRGIVCSASN